PGLTIRTSSWTTVCPAARAVATAASSHSTPTTRSKPAIFKPSVEPPGPLKRLTAFMVSLSHLVVDVVVLQGLAHELLDGLLVPASLVVRVLVVIVEFQVAGEVRQVHLNLDRALPAVHGDDSN